MLQPILRESYWLEAKEATTYNMPASRNRRSPKSRSILSDRHKGYKVGTMYLPLTFEEAVQKVRVGQGNSRRLQISGERSRGGEKGEKGRRTWEGQGAKEKIRRVEERKGSSRETCQTRKGILRKRSAKFLT